MGLLSLALLVGCQPQDTGLGTKNGNEEVGSGNGKLEVDPTELFFLDCALTFSNGKPVTVTSTGDADLKITQVRIVSNAKQTNPADGTDPNVFCFQETTDDITLAPGATKDFIVNATLYEDLPADGELRILNNG